ncbi:LAS superfamily LD-carboxypeptidase LdcB [Virgibacillus halotolerans]|uniref:M15 family metallopeptidase n=1 Tax=Virgibacillus halotolerans TaxID=1071053 RepID=UPI00195F3D42|nr:M15 family metallopeptidase [Virgibacillus halotolerans]MBM7599763.1 LAS superfamily LD-carboxypeptidase LdcB [Virgibacillus halotolerans]
MQQLKLIPFLIITGLLLAACSADDNSQEKATENEDNHTSVNEKQDIEKRNNTEKEKEKEDNSDKADKKDEKGKNKSDKAKDKDKGKVTEAGSKIAEDPNDILVLVNKAHALPDDYEPADLVFPDVRFPFTEDLPKKQMRKEAAKALEKMFAEADSEKLDLFAQSGYRSYERQDAIFAANVEKNGEKAANNYSARPGESEHQTGLVMDVTSPEVNYGLEIEFGDTKEGKWLAKHAADYGFIIRYPEEKEDITEYQYEPWHIRYVGKKAAKEIMSEGITLEEYLGVK